MVSVAFQSVIGTGFQVLSSAPVVYSQDRLAGSSMFILAVAFRWAAEPSQTVSGSVASKANASCTRINTVSEFVMPQQFSTRMNTEIESRPSGTSVSVSTPPLPSSL